MFPSQHDVMHGAKRIDDETSMMHSDEKIFIHLQIVHFFALLTASFVQQTEQRYSASVYTH